MTLKFFTGVPLVWQLTGMATLRTLNGIAS
jgi:hypothetical protein